jgi:hypothetical protein
MATNISRLLSSPSKTYSVVAKTEGKAPQKPSSDQAKKRAAPRENHRVQNIEIQGVKGAQRYSTGGSGGVRGSGR